MQRRQSIREGIELDVGNQCYKTPSPANELSSRQRLESRTDLHSYVLRLFVHRYFHASMDRVYQPGQQQIRRMESLPICQHLCFPY